MEQSQYDQAITLFQEAELCFEQVQDFHWLTFIRHERFHALRKLERYDEALELSNAIILGYRETKNSQGLSLITMHCSEVYLERYESYQALAFLRVAENILREERVEQTLPYVYSNMALSLMDLENYSEAIVFLKKSLFYYSSEAHTQERSWCLHHLGNCYRKVYHPVQAEQYYLQSGKEYQRTGDEAMRKAVLDDLKHLYVETSQPHKGEQLSS